MRRRLDKSPTLRVAVNTPPHLGREQFDRNKPTTETLFLTCARRETRLIERLRMTQWMEDIGAP